MVYARNVVDVDKVVAAKAALRTGFCVLLAACGTVSADERITIEPGDCTKGIHLVVRSVPLSEVLGRLSEALGFQLQLVGSSDSIVDVDATKPAPELIAKLSTVDNLAIMQARDPRCPGHFRVVKVWLLSKVNGPDIAARPTPAKPLPRQMSEAEKQQNRENDNAYRKAHGMPPLDD